MNFKNSESKYSVKQALYLYSAPVMFVCLLFLHIAPLAHAGDHAVILQYHHFGDDTPPSTSVTIRQFKSHLKYLKENHYNVMPLEELISLLKNGKNLPDRCVAVTIDDAYVSIYEKAFPLLKKYGYPFTVFVNTRGVEQGISSYMTWEQMRKMKSRGASYGSHSHSHDYLTGKLHDEGTDEWRARVTNDILASVRTIKKELGSDTELFAYPYGEYNDALKEIVKELGLTAFGQHSGAVWSGSDFLALPRFPMAAHFADMDAFITKVRSLPLPVISEDPENPELPGGMDMPVLRLTLLPGEYNADSISCYASGQGRIKSRWTNRDSLRLEAVANSPLPSGRSRYNCTARHKNENRYYWYSHLWIKP